jgi:hypothetical protein
MILDNNKYAILLRLRKLLILLVSCTIIVILFTTDLMVEPVLGISRLWVSLFIALLVVLYYLWGIILDHHYIYFSDNKDKIIIRYYSLKPLSQESHSIEIPKNEFVRYEIKSSMGGRKHKLILYQQTTKGIAKYPPVCLSALSQSEKTKIVEALRKILQA